MNRVSALLVQRTFDEAILDGVDVGIIATDIEGNATFVNRCAREVLSLVGSLEGRSARELLSLGRPLDAILANDSEQRWSHTLPSGDRELDLDLSISRVQSPAGDPLGYFFVFRDRQHEEQIENERRRVERLAAMGTMVAGFAHEIRNPVASLRSIAESLQEELQEMRVDLPHVVRMLRVLERIERLVRTSLLFGRPAPPRRAAHHPSALLATAISAVQPRMREIREELVWDEEPELPDVFVDDGQLVQTLVILINNAIDAAGTARRVLVRVSRARSIGEPRNRKSDPPQPMGVRFDVRDEGPGIPPDIVGRIFDPFFTTKASGTGLGLSIAQQLVNDNGGRIEVMTALGGPTTFSVWVPVAPFVELGPVSLR